jgi:hypothetical protein
VEVSVRNLAGGMLASRSVILKPKYSNIDFYIDNKILPFKFKSVAKPSLISNYLDSDIVAIPYFFNDINNSDIEWILNNNKINLLENGDRLRLNIIRNKDNINVGLNIKLKIINKERILQSAESKVFSVTSKSLRERFNDLIEKERRNTKVEENSFFGL